MPTSADRPSDRAVHWPPWSLRDEPEALAQYVLPGTVARHVRIPAGSDESAVTRLRTVWRQLADVGAHYAYEPPGSGPDGQLIRPPAEVLVAPRNGTCLDLALVLAAACGHAGLPAAVIVVERDSPTPARHALVAVALSGTWPPGWDAPGPMTTAPEGSPDHARHQLDHPRPLAVLDPVGLARSLGTSRTAGTEAMVEDAAGSGYRYLTSGAWNWRLGLRVTGPGSASAAGTAYRPAPVPEVLPLGDIHRDPGTGESALRLLRPEYQVTPFQPRDELPVLTDLCERIAAGDRTGLLVVHGSGGAGKTRLALETAAWLRQRGWYAGPLREGLERADPSALPWLATITSPLCVVVDYAETRTDEVRALLKVLRNRTGPPAAVLLTSRTAYQETPMGTEEADWLRGVLDPLITDGHPYLLEAFALPPQHPHGDDVFTATLDGLARSGSAPRGTGTGTGTGTGLSSGPAPPPASDDTAWSTLDLVLLGWLASLGTTDLPGSRTGLYDEVLRHEQRYWSATFRELSGVAAPRGLLQLSAACLTLLAPRPADAVAALPAVPALSAPTAEPLRRMIARTFTRCLRPGPGEGLALRPDRVGDHLMVTVLHRDLTAHETPTESLLERALNRTDGPGVTAALGRLDRAGQDGPARAVRLIETAVTTVPGRWRAALDIAARQRGPAESALKNLVDAPDSPVPLAELSRELPPIRLGLAALAGRVDRLRLAEAHRQGAGPATRAALLSQLSQRRADEGDMTGSLSDITEAVRIWRHLARTDPATHLLTLAQTLSDQAVRRAQTADHHGAVEAANEAVELFRDTDAPLLDPRTRSYAGALNNLSAWRSEAGQARAAADAAAEATALRRRMFDADAAQFRPDLAEALANLAIAQYELGLVGEALDIAEESADHYRLLATEEPAAFAPDYANALSNLAIVRTAAGDAAGALAVSEQAVRLRREFTGDNPAGLQVDLARALWNVSNRRRRTADNAGAVEAAEEALQILRPLAEAEPRVFAVDLAGVFLTLAHGREAVGDGAASVAAATEAVELYRGPAAAMPTVFAHDLAAALMAQSNAAALTGDHLAALHAAREAVDTLAPLAEAEPPVFRTDLAAALLTLAEAQQGTGDAVAAVATAEQAVRRYRDAARAARPGAAEDLAVALNNMSNAYATQGNPVAAVAAAAESYETYRQLAAEQPAVYREALAGVIVNLVGARLRTGNRRDALALLDEAVRLHRDAPAGEPATARLATTLHNLSQAQLEAWDIVAAARTLTESLSLWEELAAADPRHRSDWGAALNTLARLRLARADPAGASEAAARAVTAYRPPGTDGRLRPDLTESARTHGEAMGSVGVRRPADTGARPGPGTEAGESLSSEQGTRPDVRPRTDAAVRTAAETHGAADAAVDLPGLANALNTLAVCRAREGDNAAARTAAEEAVRALRRALAAGTPVAPQLALALNTMSGVSAGLGDSGAALAAITEAVELIRPRATDENPELLSDLALYLHNAGLRYTAAGARRPAAQAMVEAVRIRRRLASTDPQGTVPDLVLSTAVLADRRARRFRLFGARAAGRRAGGVWAASARAVPLPAGRALVLASAARWHAGRAAPGAAAHDLRAAARLVAEETADEAVAMAARTRHEIQAVALGLAPAPEGLPDWALASVPKEDAALIDALRAADNWPETKATLLAHAAAATGRTLSGSLRTRTALDPHDLTLAGLADLLSQVGREGLEAALAVLDAEYERAALLSGWVNAPAWTESFAYLARHVTRLRAPEIAELLAGADGDPAARRHLAVLRLLDAVEDIEAVQQLVTRPAVAAIEAVAAVEHGDTDRLRAITDANPALLDMVDTGPLLRVVLDVAAGRRDDAIAQARRIAVAPPSMHRRALGVRLHRYAAARPELLAAETALPAVLAALAEPD
jgi:hypothetical protein